MAFIACGLPSVARAAWRAVVNAVCELAGRGSSREWRRSADGRVPNDCGEDDEEDGNAEVCRDPTAADDDEQQKDDGGRNEDEVEHQQQEGAQMTLCSRTSCPSRKRDARSALMSNEVRPSA